MRVLLIAILTLFVGCTNPSKTRQVLEDQGYSDIQITGYDWWECGKDDTFSTAFIAKNPMGKVVEGTVCCGFLVKGCTTRF